MPKYQITSPDGKSYEVNAPDGATQEEVLSYAQKNFASPAVSPFAGVKAEAAPSIPKNLDVAANASNKLIASIPDAILNTPTNILNLGKAAFGVGAGAIGRPDLQPELTPNPEFGHKLMTALGLIKPQYEPQTTGQKMLDAGVQGGLGLALSPANSGRQLATNAALGSASGLASAGTKELTGNDALALTAGMLTPSLGNRAIAYGQNKLQQMDALRQKNAPRDLTIENAKDAGYVLSPSEVNPSMANHALEGIAGKLSTRQLASQENQSVTNSLARKAVGLPEIEPLTSEAMQAIRKKAYQTGYAPVEQAGVFMPGRQYRQDLDSIQSRFQGAARSFPDAVKNDVENLVDSLKVKKFDSGDAIKMTQILRDEAGTAFRNGDATLAQAKKSAAKAIEDQIERNLQGQGKSGVAMLQDFRDSRTLMAKAHTVEDSIKEGGANVIASKLAARLQAGKPLSGELKTIAETANVFPKNMQSPEMMGAVPGFSPLDFFSGAGLGVAGSMATGSPLGASAALLPAARPLARSLLLSEPFQKIMAKPNYSAGAIAKALAQGEVTPQTTQMQSALMAALIADQESRNK